MTGRESASEPGSEAAAIEAADAIDLAHLGRQTLGDAGLRRELLKLFVDHVFAQLPRLRSAATARERSELAHSIRSAALGVGAFAVARFAREIELAPPTMDRSLTALEGAVEAATAQIGELNGS